MADPSMSVVSVDLVTCKKKWKSESSHKQIGSGPPGAPLALEAAKCGGRRITTVLIADLAPAQWTRFSFYRGCSLAC